MHSQHDKFKQDLIMSMWENQCSSKVRICLIHVLKVELCLSSLFVLYVVCICKDPGMSLSLPFG